MRIKRKNGLKMIVIALVLLLCLALAVGITGAYYQAKRQATGTLSMDQGIVIDYKGFNKGDENIWQREKESTFLLFSETDAQPGEHIAVNAAGIRANTKSVDFYARVKLSYKFYNNDTEVTLANASDLITTSANFFGTNWVDGGSSDGYYYYATGTTLNKFNKDTQTFVDLFATGAEFVIEGENFTGATSDGEGGGFKIDETTSINKIEVYFTLETLQGDADAAAEGWKIEPPIVDFEKITNAGNGEVLTLNGTKVTDEKLNVTINDTTTSLETVKFPYDEEVVLNFDSRNVDYITLNYSNGETETFGEKAEDFANAYDENTKLKVTANSSKGRVTGYIVGVFNNSEYKGYTFSTIGYNPDYTTYEISNGVTVSAYFGDETTLNIPDKVKVRKRDFKIEFTNCVDAELTPLIFYITRIEYPCKINNVEIQNMEELITFWESAYELSKEEFQKQYSTVAITYSTLCETSNLFATSKDVVEIGYMSIGDNFGSKENRHPYEIINLPNSVETIAAQAFTSCYSLKEIKLSNNLKTIGSRAFQACSGLLSITIPNSVTNIEEEAFYECTNLTTTIGEGWVKASDNSAVDASTLLKDIDYDIKRT